MTKGKWFGATDAGTSNSCFWFEGEGSDFHHTAFAEVKAKLEALAGERDGNDCPKAQLVYLREAPDCHVVAYRFTSDYAYNKHNSELTALGASLGRGNFNPFSNDVGEKHYAKLFLGLKED